MKGSSIQVTSFATALLLSSLDRLRASRLLLPRSALERSDFVLWPISEVAARLIEVCGRSGLDLLTLSFSHLDPDVWSGRALQEAFVDPGR
jgi:hypothetical protein